MSTASPGLIRHDLHKLRQHFETLDNMSSAAGAVIIKIEKKEAQLKIAERRYLKALAKTLTYKADVYYTTGRIYSHEAKWAVRDGKLFHGTTEIDHTKLTDGNGRGIYPHSSH